MTTTPRSAALPFLAIVALSPFGAGGARSRTFERRRACRNNAILGVLCNV
jgi:hypothetical protein